MFELVVAVVLIALNGVFALSELAIVSARKSRLKSLVDARQPGAAAALALAEEPGRLLSTVQIGITLIGILAGAFSGAALGNRAADAFAAWGLERWIADPLGFGLVISAITFLSVVVGELVPKQIALRDPERIACRVAPIMRLVARTGSPVVTLLDASTRLVFRLMGRTEVDQSSVTEEEIRTLVAEAASAGVIETDERAMISAVLRLGDRDVRGLMTPRTEVDWLDLDDDEETIRATLLATPHARLPVGQGGADNILGVVALRDLLAALLAGEPLSLRERIREAPVIPDTLDALDAVNVLREASVPIGLVFDEYGHFEGIVTPADILDAIAGAFRSDEGAETEEAVRRADGSWLVAGSMPADEMADLLSIALPAQRDYETAAGLVIAALARLPETGDMAETLGWRFEVVDMDGRRVDKILATPLGP